MNIIKKATFWGLMFAALNVNAQNHLLGVTGGINWTNATMTNLFDETNSRTSFNAGFSYDYILKNNLTVGASLLYEKCGFDIDAILTDNHGNPIGQKLVTYFNYDYLTVPIQVGFFYGQTFYCFANIGLTPAMLIDSQTSSPEIIINEEVVLPYESHNLTDRVNKLDVGGIVVIGGGYKLKGRYWLFSSLSFQHSFTTITNSSYFANSKIRHYGIALNLGLKYALTKE